MHDKRQKPARSEADIIAEYEAKKEARRGMIQMLLMMPVEELIARLITEKDAKDGCLQFIIEKNLSGRYGEWLDSTKLP